MLARRDTWKRLGAEFVVIVVGVLVALAVDQWREGLSDRELGAFYLHALEQDLRSDSSILHADLMRARATQSSVAMLDSVLQGLRTPPDEESINVALNTLSNLIDPPYYVGTLQDLVSSGNSRLIDDPELRSRLLRYAAFTEGSRTWLAEFRRDSGPSGYPAGMLESEFMTFMLRGPVPPDGRNPDPRSAPGATSSLESLARDSSEVRLWLRRTEKAMDFTADLLDVILSEWTIPLLNDMRTTRVN